MKTKKLVAKLYRAEIDHKVGQVKRLWFKLLKKSLKHKHTETVQ